MVPTQTNWPDYVVALGGMIASALAARVLVGWYPHSLSVIQLSPNWAPMQRMTALEFVLCGISLVFFSKVHEQAAWVLVLTQLLRSPGVI